MDAVLRTVAGRNYAVEFVMPNKSGFWLGTFYLMFHFVIMPFHSQAHAEQHMANDTKAQAFLQAARENDIDKLRRVLDMGVPVDTRDVNGRTALLIATHANAIDAAHLLIAAGADVNAKDNLNDSPYLYAGAEGRLEILKMTIAAGADLTSVNRYGGTALTPAAHHGHVDVVRYLLTTEVNIDQVNNLGWTALLEAVILGDGSPTYQTIVRLLLEAGADREVADHDGVTPLEHARRHGYSKIFELLEVTP